MTYIMMVYLLNSGTGNSTFTSIEFDNKPACVAAAKELQAMDKGMNKNFVLRCVPKRSVLPDQQPSK